jgi:hypothetical protein
MNATQKTYCLVLAANPYPEVAVAQCDADGKPFAQRFREMGQTVSVSFPHSSGGNFTAPASGIEVIDPTPRSWAEADRLAAGCPKGSHVELPLTVHQARAAITALLTADA